MFNLVYLFVKQIGFFCFNSNGIFAVQILRQNTLNFKTKAQKVLIFRKWGRKNYSVFTTLHKVVKIASLSIIYFLNAPVVSLALEKDTSEVKMNYDLDEIEVSAQRSPALYLQVARIISVIERKEIEAAPSQSVQELLEYVAGVDVRQRGSEGVQADVSIRGSTFDQVLVLLNGINITDPQTGHHNFNLPVNIQQIERIEILEGPAARVYGPNAFSGAINIVTQKANSNALQFNLSGGKFQFFDGGISANLRHNNFGHSFSANRKSSDGYIQNTDFANSNLFYSGFLNHKLGELNAQLGFSDKQFGANQFYTPKFPNQFEQTKTLFTSVKWQSKTAFHISPAAYYRRHQDRFELFRSDPAAWYKNHNYHLTQVFGANVNSWIQWKAGKTSVGVEFRSENILSNVLGEALSEPRKVPGENGEFTKAKSRQTYSLFFEHVLFVHNCNFSAEVLGNSISDYHSEINVFPGLDVSYNFSENWKSFASYNTSLRMPTFTDLFYSGPTNVGNPDLKPETSATIEGGFKINYKYLKGNAVVFYRKGENIIDWVKRENEDVWQPQNLTKLNNLGIETSVQFYLSDKLGKNFLPE